MQAPTITDLRAAGYRMSANASAEVVARCAAAVLRDYLLHYVTSEDIACPNRIARNKQSKTTEK